MLETTGVKVEGVKKTLLAKCYNVALQADPDHATESGDTPAILAARAGHLCALVELEAAGADLDRGNYIGETPLIVASATGKVAEVAFLSGLVGTDLNR